MLGVAEFEDFLGDNIFNYLLPEYHEVVKARHQKLVLEAKEQPFMHVRIKNAHGKIFDVESKPQLFTYDDSRAILIVLHDISERKLLEKEHLRAELAEETNRELQREISERIRVERELIENQTYTRRIIDSSLDMICAADKEGEITEFNKAAEHAFGYNSREIIGKHTSVLYRQDPQHEEVFGKLLLESGEYSGEVINIRKNGDEFISYLSASVLRDENENVIGFMGVSRDITELKKSELELVESEERYRALYNQAYIGIAQVSLDGGFIQVNSQLCQMLGHASTDLLEKTIEEITHPDDIKQDDVIREKFFKEGIERVTFEKRYIHKNGATIFANITVSLVKDQDNKAMYFVTVFDDITDRKKAEEELKNSLKEKEILLKEVHHRVKNNLQVISSILNLQSSYVSDENTLEILKESQDRIKSMSYIHESLYQTKDFARINFTEYIFNLSKNLLHSYHFYEGLVEMKYDLDQIYLNLDQAIPCGLIVNELLSNSFKYAFPDKRRGVIEVKLEEVNKRIILDVMDNGIGLPSDFNIETTETLGLQLVTTLIEQIDAELTMISDQGTKFKITFARED